MINRNTALLDAHIELVRLAVIMAQGQRNTEAANEIRDDLAAYEADLDSREIAILNSMSADLYMIEDSEVYQKPLEAYQIPEQLGRAIYEAYQRKDWMNLLNMLRQEAGFLPVTVRAYLRGRAYESLGFYAAAWAFFQYAASQDNDRVAYDYFALDNLARWNREEAKRQANNYLSDPSAHPALKRLAASIAFQYFRGVEDQEARLSNFQADIDAKVKDLLNHAGTRAA